ncbi:MAG TPA: M3 family metallopeptidase [Polyangiaceae bacterium]|nr:M3 family metallopeptidase [Polyangiaceae bacterium]
MSRKSASAARQASNEARVTEILERLPVLQALFLENVARATLDFSKTIDDEAALAGLSAHDKARARRRAESVGQPGYLLTLDEPSYWAIANSADDRALRKLMYEAYFTRASDHGPRKGRFDNTPVVAEILELEHELATLFGFENYAAYALYGGPIEDPFLAERFLIKLNRPTRTNAQAEIDKLWAFAREKGVPRGFAQWDLSYYAGGYQREVLHIDDQLIRAHFPLADVVAGLLTLSNTLLGVSIEPVAAGIPLDLQQTYRITDADGSALARLELDPYAEDDDLFEALVSLGKNAEGERVLSIRGGLEAPFDDTPVLLGHAEVERFFRAFGRGLFLVLARTDFRPVQLEHDQEIASRVAAAYFSHFARHYDTLATFAKHHETRAPLPKELFTQIIERSQAHEHIWKAQALDLSLFDIRIHRDHIAAAKATQLRSQIQDTFMQVRREQAVLPPSYWTRLAETSASLFAHGQGARLWEVDWARAHAASLFAHFEASGFSRATAQRYRQTFWAANDSRVTERLSAALEQTPAQLFGAALMAAP